MAKTGRNPLTNTLEDAVQHREIWPTPTVGMVEGGEQSGRVEKTKGGAYILRKKNKPDSTFGAKLSDAILFEEKKKMWPTPQKADHLANQSETLEAWEKRSKEKKKEGINLQFALRHAVQMWPTPRATNINESYETANKRREKRKKEGRVTGGVRNLATEVQMWPTPRATNIVNKRERLSPEGRLSKDGKQRFGLNLQDAVTMWPTPIASGARRSEGAIKQMRKKVDAGEITKEEAEKMLGGSLTPKRMKPWTPKNGRK